MENTTIVPNRDGIWGPLETTLKIHPLCVSEQEIKQSFIGQDLSGVIAQMRLKLNAVDLAVL